MYIENGSRFFLIFKIFQKDILNDYLLHKVPSRDVEAVDFSAASTASASASASIL